MANTIEVVEKEDDTVELDKDIFNKLRNELKRLLEDNDMDAIEKVEELLKMPGIGKYRKQIDNIENGLRKL